MSSSSLESNITLNQFWQNHLAQWQSSGISQAKYCRQHTLASHQFSYWKRKLSANSHGLAPETKAGFARVQIAELTSSFTAASPSLSLCFRDGIQLLGITEETLPLIRQLVEILR